VSDFDLVVSGGRVIPAASDGRCDIGIRGGRIAALGEGLRGRETLDADGLWGLPGGVDGHCHMDQPDYGGARTADDYTSGTRSALCGGTTTIMTFAYQEKGRPIREAVDWTRERADARALIDFTHHLVIADPTADVLHQELPQLMAEGYTSFKIYLTYDSLKLDDRQVIRTLAAARREGAMVMVHAENSDAIDWLTEQLLLAGRTSVADMPASRPLAVEREATHRAIALSEIVGTPILVTHVSGGEAVEQIRWAQARGMRIFAETCPQYLFLTADDLGAPHFHGAKYLCCPPPRDAASQEAVWTGLRSGGFQVFSSDHSPYRFDGPDGKKVAGVGAHFDRVPPGVPGIETRLPLLFSEGVGKGRIDLQTFVNLTSTQPARLYGLFPRKGTIAVGADADLALWDPARRVTITAADLHSAVDYTPYEGREVTGWPVMTLSRGEVVWREGTVTAEPGRGRFLACDRPMPMHSA